MRPILTLFLSLALLGACGDDGGGPVTPPGPNAAVQPTTSPPPTPPPPDPATGTPFAVRGFVVAVDGPRGGNIGIWGAVVTAEDRDTGQIAGSGFSDNSGAYQITGLRGDHYILRVLPPPGYRPPPPQHIARPSAGADAEDVDFSLRYDIPELDDRFDRRFWNELLFDAYDCPTPADCPAWYTSGRAIEELSDRYLRIQANPSPSFYVVTSGFTAAEVASIKAQLPSTVVTLTGDFYYGTIESGPEDRDEIEGWVTIRQGAPEGDEIWCGRAYVGVSAGRDHHRPRPPGRVPSSSGPAARGRTRDGPVPCVFRGADDQERQL